MRPNQYRQGGDPSIQEMFLPNPAAYKGLHDSEKEKLIQPFRFIAHILGQILREKYGFTDVKVEMLPVSRQRMMMCISEDTKENAKPTIFANATGQKIQIFLKDLSATKYAQDIYTSLNTAGLPVISFEASDMIDALKEMTTNYDNAAKYQEALEIAGHLGRSCGCSKNGLRLI